VRTLNKLVCEKELSWRILLLAERVSGGNEYNFLDSGKMIALETDSFVELCTQKKLSVTNFSQNHFLLFDVIVIKSGDFLW
jgi:hypothetical protein